MRVHIQVLGVVIAMILAAACVADVASVEKRDAGFYLIAAEAETAEGLPAPTSEQQVARYDYKFLREGERSAPRFLLMPKQADVPLVLAKTPRLEEKGENGWPELWLELTPAAARNLEKLTREHLGQRVAFVVDGQPVTIHKIRSVISGGQFRVSRCTDRACQYIYGRLTSKP